MIRNQVSRVRLARVVTLLVVLVSSQFFAWPATALTPDEKYVTRLYQDFVLRPPDSSELAAGIAYLNGGGSRLSYVQALLVSDVFRPVFISEIYYKYLVRLPTAAESAAADAALQASGDHLAIEADVIGSQPYFDFVSSNVDDFVITLYQDVVGRTPTASEVSSLASQITGGSISRRDAALSVLRSSEAGVLRVNGLPGSAYCSEVTFSTFGNPAAASYCLVLDRLASASEEATWSQWYTNGGQLVGLWAQLASTQEYWDLAQ